MKWGYVQHEWLLKLLYYFPRKVVHFIIDISWDRAHYRNGSGSHIGGSSLKQLWKDAGVEW